jgi:hypothetical protein
MGPRRRFGDTLADSPTKTTGVRPEPRALPKERTSSRLGRMLPVTEVLGGTGSHCLFLP